MKSSLLLMWGGFFCSVKIKLGEIKPFFVFVFGKSWTPKPSFLRGFQMLINFKLSTYNNILLFREFFNFSLTLPYGIYPYICLINNKRDEEAILHGAFKLRQKH